MISLNVYVVFYRVNDILHIVGLMLSIEGYNDINICWDSMDTEYDVTRIVCVMSYREWVW